jgi:hypothetical protein
VLAAEIMALLDRKYVIEGKAALLRECTITDTEALFDWRADHPRSRKRRPPGTRRRIDALVVSNRGGATHLLAIEVKVSRSDFLRDTQAKRAAWMAHSDQFAYCAPAGLIDKSEVPEGCGLLEARPHGVVWAVNAPSTYAEPMADQWLRYLAYRASAAEYTNRRAG